MLSLSPEEFVPLGQLPRGVGPGTLAKLAELGLVEQDTGTDPPSKPAWRVSPRGWKVIPDLKLEPAPHARTLRRNEADPLADQKLMRCCCERSE